MSKKIADSYLNIDKPEEPYINKEEEAVELQNNYDAEYRIIQNNISQVYSEIDSSMNGGTPFFVFNVKRRNDKIKLNTEAMEMMLSQIRILRNISAELMNLSADKIFGPEQLKNLVEEKYLLAEQYFERIKEEHLTRIKKEQASRTNIDHDLTDREISQQKEKALIRKLIAEAEQAEALAIEIKIKTKESKMKIEIIKKLLGDADFNNLSIQQTYILINFLNANIGQYSQFEMAERMKDVLFQQQKAEADKKTQEAKAAEADTEMKNINNTLAKKDAGLQT
ncbi:hypothetical protein APF79_13995 [bacterium BRH_c32]|nr:MAG: hypothetical protein APF79_13995 [bacterium BRH_c32]